MSKYLVTGALPYANGKLHIGHIAGAYLPADVFVRYLKLKKEDVLFVCGTDEHGAPISILAEKQGVSPQEIVDYYHKSISDSFDSISIEFDNFSGTARKEHHKLAQEFFLNLLQNGHIKVSSNQQFYCESCKRFLADRYVEGVCPFCHKEGARGDQCDNCGKLMETLNLQEPKCKICGCTPVIKETAHWFLDLPAFEEKLRDWLEKKNYWKENILRFILGLLDEGLRERAVTRDIDWGVPVPVEGAEGKVLYVWFDAPIGYISASVEWAKKMREPDKWKDYWLNQDTKLIHFIGKDNNIFHAVFWPAMLMGQRGEFVLPHDIPANEFLNLEGDKISTSRNWAIWVDEFVEYFDGDLLRYYLAVIAPETKDSDFSWKEFQEKNNSELANVLGNLANRALTFANKHFGGKIRKPEQFSELSLSCFDEVFRLIPDIDAAYSNYQVRKAAKLIMDIARAGNKYFDETKPWIAVKTTEDRGEEIIYMILVLLANISTLLYPIMPNKMVKLRSMLNLNSNPQWEDITIDKKFFNADIYHEFVIGEVAPLFPRIDDKAIEEQYNILHAKVKES